MIYQLKITLKGSQPPIWRRIQMDSDNTFRDLHEVIQIAFNWYDLHLHEFAIKHPHREAVVHIGDPEANDDIGWFVTYKYLDEKSERLSSWLLKKGDKCVYTYDFGDHWEHEILLEKVIPAVNEGSFPIAIKAKREAPDEDSGGIWGYKEHEEGRTEKEILEEINQAFKKLPFWKEVRTELNPTPAGHSLEDWKKLYLLADRFKEMQPWRWMSDIDLFAIYDHASGQTGYCSVMGQADQHYGLAIYIGDQGLYTLVKILDDTITDDELIDQHMISLSFENREDLHPHEYQLIKELGLRYRGKKQWPSFQSYRPGMYPWKLNKQEIQFAIKVLEQAIQICERTKEDPSLIDEPNFKRIFTRESEISDGTVKWKDRWLELNPDQKEKVPLIVDRFELQRIKKNYKMKKLTWEFNLKYFPSPVKDENDERPFFPVMGMCADQSSGLILDAFLVHPSEYKVQLQKRFVETIAKIGYIPSRILVKNNKSYNFLEEIVTTLKIELYQMNRLPILDAIEHELVHRYF